MTTIKPPRAHPGTYPHMPEPVFRPVNGVRLAVFEAGPPTGPAVLLCHGFPEIAYSWHKQIPVLADAGYHVIVPDQRGYGLSEAPEAIEAYDMEQLTGDLVGLLDAYGHDKGIIIGHDFGGVVGWQMPLRHPERTAGIIGVNTPFIPRLRHEPIARMRAVLGDGMYIVYFQEPGRAEALLEADVDRAFRFFMRTRAGGPEGVDSPLRADGGEGFEAAFRASEEEWSGRPVLNDEERAVYVATYERNGFTGPINWYRNFTRNWQLSQGQVPHVDQPALMICAELDDALPPSMAEKIATYVPDVEVHTLTDCGHWTQHEASDRLNRLMLDWLARRFPA